MSELLTERLRMRPYTKADADEHLRVISDEEFRRYFPPPPRLQPTRDSVLVGIGRFTEHWHQFGYGIWALELRDGGRLVGYCGLRYERDAFYFDTDCVYYAINRADFRPDDAPYELRP